MIGLLEVAVLSSLVKIATDAVKWLSGAASVKLPDVVKKAVAYALAVAGVVLARLHVPGTIADPALAWAGSALTGVLIGWGAQVLHDVSDGLAKWAGNHPQPS